MDLENILMRQDGNPPKAGDILTLRRRNLHGVVPSILRDMKWA